MSAKKLEKPGQEKVENRESISPEVSPDAINIVRVAPYPIAIEFFEKEGAPPFKAQVVKMTDYGFLMKADSSHFYKVSEVYDAQFVLPGAHNYTKAKVKVIKTYDALATAGSTQLNKLYTVEMHFKDLTDSLRSAINTYLVRSGQKKV